MYKYGYIYKYIYIYIYIYIKCKYLLPNECLAKVKKTFIVN